MDKKLFLLFLIFTGFQTLSAQESTLSVEKIMQDPAWMGTFPSNVHWDENSKIIYFDYNSDKDPTDSLYKIHLKNPEKIEKVHRKEEKNTIPRYGDYNSNHNKKVYIRNGKLFLYDIKKKQEQPLVEFPGRISNPHFMKDEQLISFVSDKNAYVYNLKHAYLKRITNFHSGERTKDKPELSEKDEWLRSENLDLLNVVREREEKKEASKEYREMTHRKPFSFYSGKKEISNIKVSPNSKYVSFNLVSSGKDEPTIVPNYVDASGYTRDINSRSKVGDQKTTSELAIYNTNQDSVYIVNPENLPGLTDLPDYVKDYPKKEWKKEARDLVFSEANFSDNGQQAIVNIRSKDNKDRWIALVDLETGKLKTLDRQRDEAWISGPGIGWTFGGGTLGWLPDNKHIYFQSEASGYSHLYLLNTASGMKKALTSGKYEVFDPFLSNDKKFWYLTTSEVGPGERHFYKMPVMGGKMKKLTSMAGNNTVSLSPDEEKMAILYSYSNVPWELYLKKTKQKKEAKQLTFGESEEFKSYDWRDPKVIQFEAEDGAMVHTRLYVPTAEAKNDAAVIFVHGAGYLQNVHKWWSTYFREFMFNNLLTDLGYTVIDIDYRGSAGYGRDWRTAIYRHMGGKDLSDQVDGAKYLVENYGVNPEKIGIYGGSYGGFITLMALFTEAETFHSGAALRSVTDWAHYNHGYTANILNEPYEDPLAYQRSSPIYYADGLEGNLLIAHGMVDTNVHFQDVVRLTQRLIELKKDNWEMAVYPVESHGFVEPSSWTDEYKRVLKLFNQTLLE